MLQRYDQILRKWMLQPQLTKQGFDDEIDLVFLDLHAWFNNLQSPEWRPENNGVNQLQIEQKRYEELQELMDIVGLVQRLSVTYLQNSMIQSQFTDLYEDISKKIPIYKPVAYFSENFKNHIISNMSLMVPVEELRSLRTEFANMFRSDKEKETFNRLYSQVVEEINGIIDLREKALAYLQNIENAGRADLIKSGLQAIDQTSVAQEMIEKLQDLDDENTLNWKNQIKYKSLDDFTSIQELLKNEEEAIAQISNDLKFIKDALREFSVCPTEFKRYYEKALYGEAYKVFVSHYGVWLSVDLEEEIDFSLILSTKSYDKFRNNYCGSTVGIVWNLLEAIMKIDRYSAKTQNYPESQYISSLLSEVAGKRVGCIEDLRSIKGEYDLLRQKKAKWEEESARLDSFEDDFSMHQGPFQRKKRQTDVMNIGDSLCRLDDIAPENEFTKGIRVKYAL